MRINNLHWNHWAKTLFAILMLLNVQVFAQSEVITGTVLDENGEGLPGATVLVKGTTNGATTDIEGAFRLTADPSSSLIISFVGYEPLEVEVGNQTTINVSLVPDISSLDEVVVVGYGEQKKQTVTGAVESLDGKEVFTSRAVTNPALALQGQTPGLIVSRTSSRPGNEGIKMQVRGLASLNDADPLVIIDGVPVTGLREFYNMNPDDIESVSVLKDGSAAIYGSRAAHGVILVTTKKGDRGKLQVTYNSNMRIQTPGIVAPIADQVEYAELWLAGAREDVTPNYGNYGGQANMELMATGYEGIYYNTCCWGDVYIGNADKMEQYFGNSFSQQHNLSVSGGDEKTRYRISGLFADNVGALKLAYDGQKQYNLRMNFDHDVNDRISFNAGVMYQKIDRNSPANGFGTRDFYGDPFLFPAYNPFGQYYGNFNIGTYNGYGAVIDGGREEFEENQTKINMGLNIEIIDGLTAEFTGSFNKRIGSTNEYNTSYSTYTWAGDYIGESNATPTIRDAYTEQDYYNFGTYLSYKKTLLESHNFSARIGATGDKLINEQNEAISGPFTDLGVYDLNATDKTALTINGGSTQWGLYGYLGRFNYDYEGRYLVELLGRRDVSSKFAPGHKELNYWGGSLGWVLSDESFMSGLTFLDFLKLKVSYGEMGNQSGINNFNYLPLMNLGTLPFGDSPANQSTVSVSGITDPAVTWERVKQINYGVEFRVLNRLTGAFDYFQRTNDEMLVNIEYPRTLGGTAPQTNSGRLDGWGWEAVLTWRDKVGDVSYWISGNMSDSRNEIVSLAGANLPALNYNGYNVEGHPANSIWLWETDGFFESQEEAEQYMAEYGGSSIPTGLRAGDVKKVDRNGDGEINSDDYMYAGDLGQHYLFGLRFGADWNGFDFQAIFQGVLQQNFYRSGNLRAPLRVGWMNQPSGFLGRTWTESNPNAEYPRLTAVSALVNHNYEFNSYLLQNNQYMRLKNLVIGYTIPENFTGRVGLSRVRVYFSGNDLFEFTSIIDGYDPEGSPDSASVYPFMRTYAFGVDLTF